MKWKIDLAETYKIGSEEFPSAFTGDDLKRIQSAHGWLTASAQSRCFKLK